MRSKKQSEARPVISWFLRVLVLTAGAALSVASGPRTALGVDPVPPLTFTHLAGSVGGPGWFDGTSSAARFAWPTGVAVDGSGNVYVADQYNNTIRKLTPAGVVTTLAGLAGSSGSADGTGSAARFYNPRGVAVDGSGNVYVADYYNSTIRKVTPAGVVTTLAGLAYSYGSADGTGSAAQFDGPCGVAVDGSGNVYVADEYNYTIRKVSPAGVVTTLAGLAGSRGSADGTGSAARFDYPAGVAVDGSGNVYVAEFGNSTIRKVDPAGVVTTLAGLAGSYGSADGTGIAAQFYNPRGVAVDGSGNVYVADYDNNTIRKVTSAGVVTTLAGLAGSYGSADGTGSAARFNYPSGVAVDGFGNVYVADLSNNTIRKVTPAGVVTTLAGLANSYGSADGTGSAARFYNPRGVAVDGSGNVYVADYDNNTIRKVTPAGVVTTLAGLAGSYGSADGTGSAAQFNYPYGVAVDGSGNVYVADYSNNTIRKVTPAGVVTTLAGLAGYSGSADGTGSAARFSNPAGVAVDGSGNVYVADTYNYTIRKVTSAGMVTTLAGLAYSYGSADGTGSATRFYRPAGVAVGFAGDLYVADGGNNAIRKGTTALSDVATIDHASGPVGQQRQLDTSPTTATSWLWEEVRTVPGSTAALSSTSVRNPTFTPDIPGYFVFRLTASDGVVTSITTVGLTVWVPPTATVSGGGAICAGQGTGIQAALTGTSPWSVTWSDGATQSGVTSSPAVRSVSPSSTTVYTVTAVSDTNGAGTSSGSATVTVAGVAPSASVTAPGSTLPGQAGRVASVPDAGVGSTYAWTISNGTITAGQGTTTVTFTAGAAGFCLLGVTVTNSSGCSATGGRSVRVGPVWEAPLSCNTDLGATLFVPEWEVSLNGSTGSDIPAGGVDTMVEFSNASGTNMIAHMTVWTRRGSGVLNFNVPMTGGDHVLFSMRDVMNGKLNVNPVTQSYSTLSDGTLLDPCGQNYYPDMTPTSTPYLGTVSPFIQFSAIDANDRTRSISVYSTPAFGGAFRKNVWDSLDETSDDYSCTGILDGIYSGSLRGSLTIDVVNYCTQFFPSEAPYYVNDAIATVWPSGTPNVLTGSAQRKPSLRTAGDLLDPLPVEVVPFASVDWSTSPTFYKAFYTASDTLPGPQAGYGFVGDGRKPNTGRPGTLYLTMFPSRAGGGTINATARATIRPVTMTAACPSFACQLELFGAGSDGVATSLGLASVNAVTGIAEWNLSLPAAGLKTFWVNSDSTCAACPFCISNQAVLDPAPAVPWLVSACTPGSATLQAPSIPGASYFWRGPGNFTSSSQNPVISLGATGHQLEGTYFVSSLGGAPSGTPCATLGATYLKVADGISAPTAGSNSPRCAGSTLNLTASTVSGATYAWTGPNGFTSDQQLPTIANVTSAAAGIYYVTATSNGCTSAASSTTVAVISNPATPTITAPASVNQGATGLVASVVSHPGSSYLWEITNGIITAEPGTNQITFSVGLAGPVVLTVTESSAAGCVSLQASASIPMVTGGSSFHSLAPCRLFDTRNTSGADAASPALAAQETRTFTIGGRCSVPSTAKVLSVNQTVTGQTASGELVLYRGDLSATPTASSILFQAGRTRANNGILEMARDGSGTFKVFNNSAGTVHFILDVNGYFQ